MMLKCICCKDHVHIVLGEGDVKARNPTSFGWPLFTQRHISLTKDMMLSGKACEEEAPPDTETFFKKVLTRAQRQSRDSQGRFGRPYLPKGHQYDGINPIRGWFEFVEGTSDCFEYWCDSPTMLTTFFVPLTGCSLIAYITEPPKVLSRFHQEKWQGKFEIQPGTEVL